MSPKTVDVVLPVFDEQEALEPNVELLLAYLRDEFPFPVRVVIADNGSNDATPLIAADLARRNDEVTLLRLTEKGRGRARRAAWTTSDADVVSYMDVDLSTNLESLLPLVAPIMSGHSELAIGTRLVRQAHVRRRPKREVLSRGYNALVHLGFRAQFSDAQCGFKAVRGDIARLLLPLVVDDGWFFDTELLLLAQRNGLRIHEVPVDWVEDLDSRVDVGQTIIDDLRGLVRVRRAYWRGEGYTATSPREPFVAVAS
jgi:glycosyltransferase involved in cell wall biosynthesis